MVDGLVAVVGEPVEQVLLELEAGVVGAEVDAHGQIVAEPIWGVVAAAALVVLYGLYNQRWDNTQQWVLLLDVVLVGAAAVVIAEVRVRRERRFGHVATIAEVAQRAVLPTLPPTAADVRVTARYQSAVEDAVVGGDLYDVSLVGERVRLLVGDVRGKGLAAVEQAARVIRAFRQAAASEASICPISPATWTPT